MEKEVRVRFAPSPTGPLHIGGVRTALYNYLFAKKNNGKFILRIEDTDQSRFVPGAEEYIIEALNWCGIKVDEGQGVGGEYGPYRQSERPEIYREHVQKLIDEGKAYYAFDTAEELEEMRERLTAARIAHPKYNVITRMTMKNSLTLPREEVEQRLASGAPYVIRLKVPKKEDVRFHDEVRGWVVINTSELDDKVLLKSDGLPTYHLANIVDDHLMNISHVIRGEEWLPSAPIHVLLYEYFGWEPPKFCHLPLLLKKDGNGKLSKRDGDKHGFPVFPLEWKDPQSGNITMGFREQGYLPDALVNFISLLGWNPGDNSELYFNMEDLANAFSLDRIIKAGAKFDIEKGQWFNEQYIKRKSNAELSKYLLKSLAEQNIECDQEKAEKICEALKERVTFPQELWTKGQYFFIAPQEYDEKVVKKKWTQEAVDLLSAYSEALKAHEGAIDRDSAHSILNDTLEKMGIKMGRVMQALRLAVSGSGAGADLMLTLEILGKETISQRIETAIETLKDRVKA
ncbi:glutamate--tRNA ligase [Aureibacter tunicatorum]|uniref:Glutamate--tRNA ligase n=1 Tax=Aureibacter tunicatorum TaxID=866807 RepID=A0AAE3XKD7_9BACT|nr:glutamate--tRNA ligase [Aureibacter tunicatorum]MDR6237608.1 glutamyl-tRNA synthetase [Aureibacter tunicatorum]BDD02642.1 glutamate--tRNA ligase [Aureibacter tunicatorum]